MIESRRLDRPKQVMELDGTAPSLKTANIVTYHEEHRATCAKCGTSTPYMPSKGEAEALGDLHDNFCPVNQHTMRMTCRCGATQEFNGNLEEVEQLATKWLEQDHASCLDFETIDPHDQE